MINLSRQIFWVVLSLLFLMAVILFLTPVIAMSKDVQFNGIIESKKEKIQADYPGIIQSLGKLNEKINRDEILFSLNKTTKLSEIETIETTLSWTIGLSSRLKAIINKSNLDFSHPIFLTKSGISAVNRITREHENWVLIQNEKNNNTIKRIASLESQKNQRNSVEIEKEIISIKSERTEEKNKQINQAILDLSAINISVIKQEQDWASLKHDLMQMEERAQNQLYIRRHYVKIGDRVEKGQDIIEIETHTLQYFVQGNVPHWSMEALQKGTPVSIYKDKNLIGTAVFEDAQIVDRKWNVRLKLLFSPEQSWLGEKVQARFTVATFNFWKQIFLGP